MYARSMFPKVEIRPWTESRAEIGCSLPPFVGDVAMQNETESSPSVRVGALRRRALNNEVVDV
jgi:hypothetical protein